MTSAATSVSADSATLNGSVTANNVNTSVSFNWGTSSSTYGNNVSATPSLLSAGTAATSVSAGLTGLKPETTYYFQVVASNGATPVLGTQQSFITPKLAATIALASTNPSTPNTSVSWIVTFNGSVQGVDSSDFVLVPSSGATGASITSVTGSGATWTVTANTGTGTGNLGLNLVNDGSIVSTADATKKLGGSVTGPVYQLVTPRPVLSKTASASSVALNGVVVFTITAQNKYAVPLTNVTVTDVLPAGMTYQGSVPSVGAVGVSGQTVTWAIPSIDPLSTAALSLAVTLTQQGTLTNTVTSPGATSASTSVLVLANAVTYYKFDSPVGSWTGAAGEVIDSGGTSLNGKLCSAPSGSSGTPCSSSLTTTQLKNNNEVVPNPTIVSQSALPVTGGGFCNAAAFDGNAVVMVGNNNSFTYSTTLSATAWIYPTAWPTNKNGDDLYSILSNDQNYEFHLNPSGQLYWWSSLGSFTSNTVIPKNQWTHVAITVNTALGREYMYINGVLDSSKGSIKGTLANNPCPFYIGGDISTGSNCSFLPARNFRGMIDEVKLYAFELGQNEVVADMTLGRLCSGTFDHIQVEHDGVGSICSPKSVTVKACLDANCNTLYPGKVTVVMAPSGKVVGGDTVSFTGGIGSFQLSNSTAGAVTLGTASTDPVPANNLVCKDSNPNDSSSSCTVNFANASCSFDAVEVGGKPQTPLYTKLAGVPFSVDVLPLSNSTTVNSNYSGTVTVDLVDTSSNVCPAGGGLVSGQSISFVKGNTQKTVSFTYPNAARNVKVRMTVGSSTPACSSDNFAIRPQQFMVSSPMNNTALTGTPKAVAGSAFIMTADSAVGGGYDGTPLLDTTKVSSHVGPAIALNTLSGSFGKGDGRYAVGSNFKYLDVGGIVLGTDAVTDHGFTTVDQPNDCIPNSTSNTLSGGKYGCNIGSVSSNQFGRWTPSYFSFAGTLTPGCSSGANPFTYMGQDALGVNLAVTAYVSANGSTTPSSVDRVALLYDTTLNPAYATPATVSFAGDNSGTAVPIGRLINPDFTALQGANGTTKWVAGVFSISDTFAFSRLANPDGSYEAYRLTAAVNDPDGASLATSPAATNTTRVRYGRIAIGNAYGSELLPLPIPLEAQYWQSGGFYVTNRDDSCTSFNASSIVLSNTTQKLDLCETQFSSTGTLVLVNGQVPLRLTAPGVGNSGSVNLTLNTGSAASGQTCLASTVSNATAANLPQFGPNPTGRATFGVRKAPLIYRRENY